MTTFKHTMLMLHVVYADMEAPGIYTFLVILIATLNLLKFPASHNMGEEEKELTYIGTSNSF